MRHVRLILALALGIGGLLALVLIMGRGVPVAWADVSVLYVHSTCTGGVPSPCYTSIQKAVDTANPGDLILIATGIYSDIHTRQGITQVVYISKSLALRGGYNEDFTEWDPDKFPTYVFPRLLGRGIVISGPATVTLEGLIVTAGNATGLRGLPTGSTYDSGGGLVAHKASVYIYNSTFLQNVASTATGWSYCGGALFNQTSGVISGTVFRENIASTMADYGEGGGLCIFNSDGVLVQNSRFYQNIANSEGGSGGPLGLNLGALGGGLSVWNSHFVTLTDNLFQENRGQCAAHCAGNGGGGALAVWDSDVLIEGNQFLTNTAAVTDGIGWGGGLYVYNSDVSILSSLLWNNVAIEERGTARGGGVYITQTTSVTLVNTVVAKSNAQGIYLEGIGSRLVLLHDVLADNVTSALLGEFGTTALLTNTIVAGSGKRALFSGGILSPAYTLFWNNAEIGITGTHPIFGDPLFADPAGMDYHIRPGSPAVDRGIDAGVTVDVDGDPRPQGARPDIGIDEIYRTLLPLVMRGA